MQVGDNVNFIDSNGKIITKILNIPFYTELHDIPIKYIKHGSLSLCEDIKTNPAIIKHIFYELETPYYMVRYIDYFGIKVQLGFKKNQLKLIIGEWDD